MDDDEIRERINDKEIHRLLAPIVYLVVLMVVGIPGNLTVLLIYRQKYSKSVYRTIIWNLAMTDFLFCTLTFPFNIGRLFRYFTFYELWVCKAFTTLIVFFIMYSSHLLVTLAFHRFRQVCMPLRRQVTTENVKYWIIGSFFLAVFLDIPECVLQPLDEQKLTEGNVTVTGYVCAVSFKNNIYAEVYNGFLTFLFTLYATILFALYIVIGRKMYLQRRMRQETMHTPSHADELSSKITKIAVTVSAVFAFSYLPLFVLKLVAGKFDTQNLSAGAFAALKIFERSYAFNHVANPFIYAFFDNRFRQQFKALIMTIFCRRCTQAESYQDERNVTRMRETSSTTVS
ncbi:neuropeptide Y receptor type 4-like [Mytilus trossulus]|uniref:neuropeptide Y receptor type 4-like n=1 Tax=Mytilus trossulus TaxID=6551 RepID=UPI0030054AE7